MTDYITVQPIDGGYRVLAHRTPVTACRVCITPYKDGARTVKRHLDAVIERAVSEVVPDCVSPPYFTVLRAHRGGAGWVVFVHPFKNVSRAFIVHTTPHRDIAHGIKADLEAVIKRAIKDALAVRQLELL